MSSKKYGRGRQRGVDPTGRSKTDRFVKLDYGLLNSEAWQCLSPRAVKLYISIRKRYNGVNNGEIGFSVREAMQLLGCGPNTASECFHELQTKGFLICRRQSHFDLKTREAREWEITAERRNEHPPSRDFRNWRAEN